MANERPSGRHGSARWVRRRYGWGLTTTRPGLRFAQPQPPERSPSHPSKVTQQRVQGSRIIVFPNLFAFLWVAGAERSEAPVFVWLDQPGLRPDGIGTQTQPPDASLSVPRPAPPTGAQKKGRDPSPPF